MTQHRSTMKDELPDELLQRYFDEALAPGERAEVEARLDADARLRLDALTELRSLLRERTAAEASGVDFSSTIEAIARAEIPLIADPPPVRRRRALMPLSAVGGFLAAAAAIFVLWRPVISQQARFDSVQTDEAEVETLEVQGAIATVFKIEDSADPSRSATVIWADDDDAADPGPGGEEE